MGFATLFNVSTMFSFTLKFCGGGGVPATHVSFITVGERLLNAFMKNANVGSVGSLSSTAKIAQTTPAIHAVVHDMHAPNWVYLGLFWVYLK